MRKILASFLALILVGIPALMIPAQASSMTLYQCYQKLGKGWPSVEARATDAAEFAVWQYKGTAEQNKLLTSRMCPESDLLGYSVASGYEKNLRVSMNSTQTFVPVTSLTLKDSTTLTMSALGDVVFLTLEPGTTREEIVMCTNINTSTINFDPCTRGLAFSGTSTASVTANRKAHSAGSKVVMSNVHYVYEQLVDKTSDETIQGSKTATGTWYFTVGSINIGDNTTAVNKTIFARNGDVSLPFLRYNETTNRWQFSDDGTNTTNLATSSAAGLSASTTRGIGITDSFIHINASTTLGMAFGLDGYLYQKTNNTLGIDATSTGLYLNGAGNIVYTGQNTFSATTTLATTTISQLTLGGENANTLVNDSNADSLHTHNYTHAITVTSSQITSGSSNNTLLSNISSTSTIPTSTLPGRAVRIKAYLKDFSIGGGNGMIVGLVYGGSTVASCQMTAGIGTGTFAGATVEGIIFGSSTSSAQHGYVTFTAFQNGISDTASAYNGETAYCFGGGATIESMTSSKGLALYGNANGGSFITQGSYTEFIKVP